MKAVLNLTYAVGESFIEEVALGQVEIPFPGPREILIRIQCAGVNRMDLLQVKGKSPPPPGASPIIGVEVAGTISALGDDCKLDFMLGEAVMALMTGGGYAEFVCVDERMVFRALPGIDMKILASIPEAFITAYQLCFFVGQLKSGESALFHAASSSVGQAAIQLAVRKGIKVFATTRSENKAIICTDLGASYAAVVENDCLFAEKIIRQNCGLPVNAVFDCVGESYMNENLNVLGMDGKIILYGLLGGRAVEDANFLGKLMAKRISILPTTLRGRSVEYKNKIINAFSNDPDGLPAIASGEITVHVDATFTLENWKDAHELMEENKNAGKIILTVSQSSSTLDFFEKELNDLIKRK